MLTEEVLKCSFSQWFSIFGHLSIKSEIIKIDDKFRDYILSDGIVLPECCNSESAKTSEQNENIWEIDEYDDDNPAINLIKFGEPKNDEDVKMSMVIEFPHIEKQMRRSLRRFLYVFPKLNWSSCEDASWVHAAGTKCSDLTNIFLLLKSSDKIVHDLTEPFKYCDDYDEENPPKFQYELILREWMNMNPSMEFRCFVAKDKIIGISQRDVRTYYEYIQQEKTQIIQDIKDFFQENIQRKFSMPNYVMDILRPMSGTIILIDMNVFGELTDSLLFDWEELRAKADGLEEDIDPQMDFRFIENRYGIQRNRFEMNSLPLDVFNGNIQNIFDVQNDKINDTNNVND